MLSIFILATLGLISSVWATTRHVPVDYPTIQAAFDVLSDSDTVLVDLGVYEEALMAPSLSFTLRGNVFHDTGDYPRPVVDPSSLPNPTGRTCLRKESGAVVIEDMTFRNRLPMYPHTGDTTGGIYHPHGEIVLHRCVFDSTFNALFAYWADVTVNESDFRNISGIGIRSTGSVVATDCNFHSNMVLWAQLSGRSGTRVERCRFSGNYTNQSPLHLGNADIVVRDCRFGPGDASAGPFIQFYCENSIFENNVIEDFTTGGDIFVGHIFGEGRVEIRNNVLRNCFTPMQFPERTLHGFYLQMQESCDSCVIVFDSNVVENCVGHHGAPGMYAFGGRIEGRFNRFTGISPAAVGSRDSLCVLRDNLFYDNAVALESDSHVVTDARWNWWGDSTGPYHSELNPNGQGDEIRGDATLFVPWHQDTSFFPNSILEEMPPLPRETELAVFPNPFNSQAVLKFTVPDPLIARFELFDITGRRVRELWSGVVIYEKELHLNGNDLASGLYFVRVIDIHNNRPAAMAKVVLLK